MGDAVCAELERTTRALRGKTRLRMEEQQKLTAMQLKLQSLHKRLCEKLDIVFEMVGILTPGVQDIQQLAGSRLQIPPCKPMWRLPAFDNAALEVTGASSSTAPATESNAINEATTSAGEFV
eukprot:NODE_3615_length_764_cov_188.519041.p2 GENE.NODE_3615_length_764_cov_188.519041~~NODE_3615_length_764_cov_188.519041.p2  ORF type:complete len:122 (-),score=38.54 NODE_3615_length_764_cov_188.519041:381-746(-)